MARKLMIIDDEQDARLLLREYISVHSEYIIIAESNNGADAVQKINELRPDIIFIDIKMPGLNGFEVVRQMIHTPQIVFTTAYDKYALQAFNANAVDYLLKPYTEERFIKALEKAISLPSLEDERIKQLANDWDGNYFSRILVESAGRFINIKISDILYIEAEKDYCRIYTDKRNYLSKHGIGIMELRLDPNIFIRIHRGCIVNIEHVRELYKDGAAGQLIMNNNQTLTISRSYMEAVKRLIF